MHFQTGLWFAEKFVSLLIEQHLIRIAYPVTYCCDLLKNSYLCLLNNTATNAKEDDKAVVICWKIRIFAYWTTPLYYIMIIRGGCDLLKNSYLCLLNNTVSHKRVMRLAVVICWKIRIFAYWTTPFTTTWAWGQLLWFAEKFVSLLIEQHRADEPPIQHHGCDLLKNSYLCLLNNTLHGWFWRRNRVVICWKIRIFAYWTTPWRNNGDI